MSYHCYDPERLASLVYELRSDYEGEDRHIELYGAGHSQDVVEARRLLANDLGEALPLLTALDDYLDGDVGDKALQAALVAYKEARLQRKECV